jgi:hypothetical protein
MLTDRDFERCATLLIDRYGPRAAHRADLRVDQLMDQAQAETSTIWREVAQTIRRLQLGCETWHRILNAIERLQAKAPADGEGCTEVRRKPATAAPEMVPGPSTDARLCDFAHAWLDGHYVASGPLEAVAPRPKLTAAAATIPPTQTPETAVTFEPGLSLCPGSFSCHTVEAAGFLFVRDLRWDRDHRSSHSRRTC